MEIAMYNTTHANRYMSPQECDDRYPDYEHHLNLYVNKVLVTPEGFVSNIVVNNNCESYLMGRNLNANNAETMLGKLFYIKNVLDNAR